VTRGEYTRYTLRLGETSPQEPSPPAYRRCDSSIDADDDWSGLAATAPRPDDEALDYRHPDAVSAVKALQPAGWQVADDGDTLVFWLAAGSERSPEVVASLAALRGLGRLEAIVELPGWEDAWQSYHQPRIVGRFCVRPPWHPPRHGFLDLVLEIDRAFGTGGHPSTRQCLEEIQSMEPGSLLDIGSGSGVLALAALKLGYAPVWGIDIDPVAVEAAVRNAALNGLPACFSLGDAADLACCLPQADAVVANLALQPILRLARRVADEQAVGRSAPALAPAHLLLAGLLVEQEAEAAAAFPDFEVFSRRRDDAWVMLHLTRLQ